MKNPIIIPLQVELTESTHSYFEQATESGELAFIVDKSMPQGQGEIHMDYNFNMLVLRSTESWTCLHNDLTPAELKAVQS